MGRNKGRDRIGGCIRIGLGLSVSENCWRTIQEVGRRKARRKRKRRDTLRLKRREPRVDALARLHIRALPADRDQERQLPERFCKALARSQQQCHVARSRAAGVGHIDMRVSPIRDQRVRVLNHGRRDVGVEIEADHQRQILADDLAHARKDFAFAIVEVLSDHRAVQVEIDPVEITSGSDAIHDHCGDALIGVFTHMSRWTCGAPHGRHQLPTCLLRFSHEAGHADIDVVRGLEKLRAFGHGRPAATVHEVLVRGLRRSKGIGLVEKSTNSDARHRYIYLSSHRGSGWSLRQGGADNRPKIGKVPVPARCCFQQLPRIGLLRIGQNVPPPALVRRSCHAASP